MFQGGGVEPERKRGGKERERERRRKRKKLTRVSTRTLTPQATRRRTSLAPTVPVAPVIATSPLIPAAASELAAATAAWELAAATLLLAAEARGEGGGASVVIVDFDRRSTPRRPAGLTAFESGDRARRPRELHPPAQRRAGGSREHLVARCLFIEEAGSSEAWEGAFNCVAKKTNSTNGAITVQSEKRKKKNYFFPSFFSSSSACAAASRSLSCWSGSGLFPWMGSL